MGMCFRSATVWGHQSLHAKGAGWVGAATGWACHPAAERGRWGPFMCALTSITTCNTSKPDFHAQSNEPPPTIHIKHARMHKRYLKLSALPSLVLWGENARWRERLVSCYLCHRDHQPHSHGEQCATHEAPAQRDQCLRDSQDVQNNKHFPVDWWLS